MSPSHRVYKEGAPRLPTFRLHHRQPRLSSPHLHHRRGLPSPLLHHRRISPRSPFIAQPIAMPLVQTRPRGQTVRFIELSPVVAKLTKKKTRTFVEGYHFGPLRSRREVVRFATDVPTNETLSNPRYVDMKSKYSRTSTSRSVHESRVHIGRDMFLVSGYWDPKADVNRSAFALTKSVWRGELSIVRAGRYVPYHKRMKDGYKADLAVKRYVSFMFCCSGPYDIRQVCGSLQAPKNCQEARSQSDPPVVDLPIISHFFSLPHPPITFFSSDQVPCIPFCTVPICTTSK